jgi:DNA-binding transcriptional ArsR family regulator
MAGRIPSSQGDLLADPVRAALVRHVEQNPGISAHELRKELDLTKSAMGYHRRVLVEAGILHERKAGRYVVLTAWASRIPTRTRLRGTTRKVAEKVAEAGFQGVSAGEAAASAGVSPRTARGQLQRLATGGLVGADRMKPCRYRATEALRRLLSHPSDSGLDEDLR